MKYNSLLLILALLVSVTTQAQITNRSGDIYTEISSKISSMPSSSGDNYHSPDSLQLNTWASVLNLILSGEHISASDSANKIGYRLVNFTDTSVSPNENYIVLENVDTNFWGTYVFNPNYCRSVVIQSPHPKKDANTGHQGIFVFKNTKSMLYQVSGTHRCNSSSYSSCSGTTTGCSGSSEPYRISDLSHTTQSLFQKTTEIFSGIYHNTLTYIIQLHGFVKLNTDPFVILSNGTQVVPNKDFHVEFKNNLYRADTSLTFKIAHIDKSWTRLRGFNNTQGRRINNSPNACNSSATTTTGQFFHIEQERTKLRADSTGWAKIAYAINETFTCFPNSTNELTNGDNFKVYPNPTFNSITVESKSLDARKRTILIFDLLGHNLTNFTKIKRNDNSTVIDLTRLSPGIYILKVDGYTSRIYKQ